MRPTSIVQFERFYLGALGLGLVNNLLNFSQATAVLNDPNVQAAGLGTGFLVSTMVIGFAIPLLLWYFIARRGSNIAKWIAVVLFGLGAIGVLMSLSTMFAMGTLSAIVGLVVFALQAYAMFMLFQPDARAWLEGGSGPTNPDVFN
jgi:hypothetical protein